ncbi:aspartyl/asparaginyl beta-hydroxylase domain-containing protein [Sphingomonas sp. M1-B02]|uniref:aspartyl/asparaginyl beta-hydroxylase domain-containing protein n=1 Tax=Sphingomonas sp. M1-B02 TaxID=3114300 RepID=UPI002240983A|nr:aspartyl/asparaginyl beta-hydroxylase domain-containing protein [Sphingomonas sp. S6-11]UZK65669.1 aspartyl/asparaginyl beta-hydroxylase domain-containing protein [Sphingomonas sp. S6-11]
MRLPIAFDPAPLRADLARLAGREWTPHFVPQHYEGEWSALPLRAKRGAIHPILMIAPDPAATEFEDAPLLSELPAIAAAVAAFECPLRCVRLMRLAPGASIKPHSDFDLEAECGLARIRVPIVSNPGVEFILDGTPVAMAPGEAWYLRLSETHSAANRGESDRIHLVIDALVNGWLAALLAGPAG